MTNTLTSKELLPYLTGECPGIGGIIKRYNEDFVVDEIPRYEPSGSGTHTYLRIEKSGVTTLDAVRLIANALGKHPRDVGYAGMKDAHGVTRQWISIEHVEPARLEALSLNRIRVVEVARHTNKIKLGHLAGNRFAIKVREAEPDGLERARAIVSILAARGVPNYFGPQRFGARGDNAEIGRAVLRGDYQGAVAIILGQPNERDHGAARAARERFDAGDLEGAAGFWGRDFREQSKLCRALIRERGNARRAWRTVHHTLRKLYVSALQSELFNRVVALRIQEIDRVRNGDIAYKHQNGACFLVEDAKIEQPRCSAFEISPTGPLFGRRMTEPAGQPAETESHVLEASGLAREEFRAMDGSKLDGARRPLRVPLADPQLETGRDERGPFVCVSFVLPPGAYATSVMRELCKNRFDERSA